MTYDMYRYLFITATCISILLLLLSVILCIKLNVPKIIKDLTGLNARKAIDRIRSENEKTGEKVFKSSHTNLERGKLTDKISASGKISPATSGIKVSAPTEKIGTAQLFSAEETTLLHPWEEFQQEAAVGQEIRNEDTTVLEYTYTQGQHSFVIEFDITFLHTNEIIV